MLIKTDFAHVIIISRGFGIFPALKNAMHMLSLCANPEYHLSTYQITNKSVQPFLREIITNIYNIST